MLDSRVRPMHDVSEKPASGKGMTRKVRHLFRVSDPQFHREMSVMLGPSITSGNRVTALHNGDEIFPAMLEAIRGASVSITFETYVYWSGETGREFADLWKGRAQDPEHWRDTHFQVEGPVVAQFQAAFNDNWIKTTGVVLSGATVFPPIEPVGALDAHMFIASPSGGGESMHLMYLMAIAAEEEDVDLAAA